LSLLDNQLFALFAQHAPEEFDLKLVGKNGVEYTPIVEHFFNAEHTHDSEVTSISIEMPGWFEMYRMNAWLDMYLRIHGPDVYRMKGVVGIRGETSRIVFQGVHMLFDSQAGKPWGNETPTNRMVFIGKNLDERYIRQSLESCLA
jgi:G3E family GTPase